MHSSEGKTQWQRFAQEVARLNYEAPSGTFYKVLYLGRHGQGVHNVAETKYGTAEWDVSIFSSHPQSMLCSTPIPSILSPNNLSTPLENTTTYGLKLRIYLIKSDTGPPKKATPHPPGSIPISQTPASNKPKPSTRSGPTNSPWLKHQRQRNTIVALYTGV